MSLRARLTPSLPRADLNLTPMIDVMLVLLMIFMIVVPVIASMVDLPAANNPDSRPEEPDEITLTLFSNLWYQLEATGGRGSSHGDTRDGVAVDRLQSELRVLYNGRTRDRILYLKADSSLPFGAVERVIEFSRKAGVRVVGAVTERRVQRM